MRRFGIILIGLGAGAYYFCSQQLATETPVPAGLSIEESLEYPAGRYEVAEHVAAMVGGIGLLMLVFPQGR
jgi:hypothetical protein